jgi:hypothetical protein
MRHTYTKEEDKFLIDNVKGITELELVNKFNKHFNLNLSYKSIKNRKHRLKIKNKLKGGFKKGYDSNRFKLKKGDIAYNSVPIGTEVEKDGYIWIKIKNGSGKQNWIQKHRLLWEQYHGKIPKGYVLIFKDGNKKNITLDNLALVSRKELLILNDYELRFNKKEITESGINIAKLISEIRRKK